ncbi:MAG TPA: hypothetical protein VF559_01785 [Caulobacteraceae bacterium]|jgi:hypothetical protein
MREWLADPRTQDELLLFAAFLLALPFFQVGLETLFVWLAAFVSQAA